MAVVTITPVQLVRETASADLPDASGTAITAGIDGFVIANTIGFARNVLIKMVEAGGTAGSVDFDAGAKPPAITAGLGPFSVPLAASDVKYVTLESARFTQADGTITGKVSGVSVDDVTMTVFLLPRDI